MKTIPPLRETDAHGSGHYGAPRKGHTHNGVDLAVWPGTFITSLTKGIVTKLGWAYADHPDYRYVQVTTDELDYRYFYVTPMVSEGELVNVDTVLGKSQDLRIIYKDITPHLHFEVKKGSEYLNPMQFLQRSEV